jgi:hypothetical protein
VHVTAQAKWKPKKGLSAIETGASKRVPSDFRKVTPNSKRSLTEPLFEAHPLFKVQWASFSGDALFVLPVLSLLFRVSSREYQQRYY